MTNIRRDILATGEYYHVFNKTIAGFNVFNNLKDLLRITNLLNFYRYPQEIRYSFFQRLNIEKKNEYLLNISNNNAFAEIYAFAFMPNHFHLLLKQLSENGIKIFLSNFQNSFAKYYNLKYDRFGTIFLKSFKAKHISNDEEFLHVSRYIHLNPVTSYLIEYDELKSYPYNSFKDYVSNDVSGIVNTELIIKLSGSKSKYSEFVKNHVDYQRELKKIEHLIME